MKGTYLGEFEELVLLTVGILYDDAYGLAITDELFKTFTTCTRKSKCACIKIDLTSAMLKVRPSTAT